MRIHFGYMLMEFSYEMGQRLHVGDRWAYCEAYGDGCTAKMGLVYPMIEDDVYEINKELLIHFSIK